MASAGAGSAVVGGRALKGATRDLLTILPKAGTLGDAVKILAGRLPEAGSISTRLLYEYVLDRPPENGSIASRPIRNLERDLRTLIESEEYRFTIARRVLLAFPEYKREFFLHIPKSGGTTVSASMEETHKFISLPSKESVRNGNVPDFGKLLADTARRLARRDATTFTVHGHLTAQELLQAGIKRFDDPVFTVVRDPEETAISFLNYILTKLEAALGNERCDADVGKWRKILDLDASFAPSKDENLNKVTERCFDRIVGRNVTCAALGLSTADSALEFIARFGIEVIDFAKLHDYIIRRGWNANLHKNKSDKFVTMQSLGTNLRSKIPQMIGEDIKLYRVLKKRWGV